MSGPFAPGERAVRWHTWRKRLRVYKLMITPGGPFRYVGRSDTDVRARLLQHVENDGYRYFWVVHESDSVAAFLRSAACGTGIELIRSTRGFERLLECFEKVRAVIYVAD